MSKPIILDISPKINKVPDYQGKQMGKLQVSSRKIHHLIGQKVKAIIFIYTEDQPYVFACKNKDTGEIINLNWEKKS